MRTRLSSYGTFLPQLAIPLVISWTIIEMIFAELSQGNATPNLIGWGVVLGALLAVSLSFAWYLAFAWADGEIIHAWTIRGRAEIPFNTIRAVTAVSKSRYPHIVLLLDPPAAGLGAKIIIMPPIGLTKEQFWAIYESLSGYARRADHDGDDAGVRGRQASRTWIAPVLWLLIAGTIITLFALGSSAP